MTRHDVPVRLLALAIVLAVMAASLIGCGDDDPADEASDDGPSAGGIELVSADVERAPADPAAAASAGQAITGFGTDLYGAVRDQSGNLAVSPYSVAAALSMTRAGALGETADEMDTVLGATTFADLHAAFGSLDAELATRPRTFPQPEGDPLELELSFANALWAQRGYPFEQAFLEILARHYGAAVQTVDYVDDAEGARQAINDWVADQTRQRITDLIPPGVLDAFTRLVLTNALYLKAPWQHTFTEGATTDAPFTLLDGSTVQTPLMRNSAGLPYGAGDGWKAVELAYQGGSLSMVVAVPDAGTFDAFERSLDAARIAEIHGALRPEQVDLGLPSWEFRTQVGLNAALESLGMPTAFTDQADFSAMSTEERLQITDVLHEVFIAVDEDGTEAAAATAVVVGTTSAPADPIDLIVDRPFLFWIVDRPTDAVLFLGRVVDPTRS